MGKSINLQTRRAFCLSALSALCCCFPVAAFSADDAIDLSNWSESSSRKAGTRQTLTVGEIEIGLVWIPAGEFDMGSPATEQGRRENEEQIHVKLTRGFWMLETEVTQELYKEVMKTNPSDVKGDRFPVELVSWGGAARFCERLTKRLPEGLTASLPTEAQWEYACRAGSKTAFSFGDSANPDLMNLYYRLRRTRAPIPVKSYPANAWGLYDMHGNVYEWVRDVYVENYLDKYGQRTVVDPESVSDDPFPDHVARGGSWICDAKACRSAHRLRASSGLCISDLGFRFQINCDPSSDESNSNESGTDRRSIQKDFNHGSSAFFSTLVCATFLSITALRRAFGRISPCRR